MAGLYATFQNTSDKWLDEELILLGRDYLEGGKEFYAKEKERGLLLRKGLGKKGEEYFEETGDLQRMWFEPIMSATPDSMAIKRIEAYEQLLA